MALPYERQNMVLDVLRQHPDGLIQKDACVLAGITSSSLASRTMARLVQQRLAIYDRATGLYKPGTPSRLKLYDMDTDRRAAAARLGKEHARKRKQERANTLGKRIEAIAQKAEQCNVDNLFGSGWYLRQHAR